MPVNVPDYVLTVERVRLGEFFLLFARFEFAVKASGHAKMGRWGAEIDWDKLSDDVEPKLLPPKEQELADAIDYLERLPPKQQKYDNDQLHWEPRPAPSRYSRMRSLIFYVQGVRNNLAHGAKFLTKESEDPVGMTSCSTLRNA